MPTAISSARSRAFLHQKGRCFYCGQPMWLNDAASFARRLGLKPSTVRHLQATAEHLIARCDGGKGGPNIVAAHALCNMRRHQRKEPLSAEQFQKRVRSRMLRQKWLPFPNPVLIRWSPTSGDSGHADDQDNAKTPP
jgi:hypothetical protein